MYQRPQRVQSTAAGRQAGIALLLVMVVFIVLYMVVYQLHFSTRMEEKIAEVRYGDVEGSLAVYSTSLYAMTLLTEDLKQDLEEASQLGGGGGATGAMPGVPGEPPPGDGGGGAGGEPVMMEPINATGNAGRKWYDFINENIFNDNQQQVGDVSVKVVIRDGERAFNLNQIFDYARLDDEQLVEGEEDLRNELEDIASSGASDDDVAGSLRDRILAEKSVNPRGGEGTGAAGADGEDDALSGLRENATGSDAQALDDLDSYEPDPPFEDPLPERVRATEEMLRRAILMVFSINENNGFPYAEKYFPETIATAIVDYVLERRRQDFNNRILLVSELLSLDDVTPEVYYGPYPPVGEENQYEMDGFVLERDEYGDVSPRFVYDDFELADMEAEREEVAGLLEQYGQFADLPGMNLSRLQSNSLTRGMSERPMGEDENGEAFVLQPPKPIGLKDIFTTFSTGKINLNTASVPVLFGLLLSVDEEEANTIALDIQDYRNREQQIADEEGVERVDDGLDQLPDLGQPRRSAPPEEDDLEAEEEAMLENTYQDMETNYFTNLQQLELIDGVDGGPEDLLQRGQGVDRVSAEDDPLLRRVTNDFQKVMVFGSTYFTVEMKTKTRTSRSIKTHTVVIKRDVEKGRVEVVMSKELQK